MGPVHPTPKEALKIYEKNLITEWFRSEGRGEGWVPLSYLFLASGFITKFLIAKFLIPYSKGRVMLHGPWANCSTTGKGRDHGDLFQPQL